MGNLPFLILVFLYRKEEDKDTLLDTNRLVKGDNKDLTVETRKLFLNIQESGFGFTGITNKLSQVQKRMKDILMAEMKYPIKMGW